MPLNKKKMLDAVKTMLFTLLPEKLKFALEQKKTAKELIKWKNNGEQPPIPHIIKQQVISDHQKKSGYAILVETGTFLGDMVEAQKKNFKKIISIELSEKLHRRAVKRFKNDASITIVQGDSGKKLAEVISNINEPAIFWLDGHYSAGITARGEKDCPIFEEIDSIFSRPAFKHILLVDDAMYFNGKGDYPTIAELTAYIQLKDGRYNCKVEKEIICYTID